MVAYADLEKRGWISPDAAQTLRADNERLRAALAETVGALEVLRRGHGAVVSELCFPALNIGRTALEQGAKG